MSSSLSPIQSHSPASSAAPAVRVAEVTPYLRRMRSRMPFRFGKTVMTGMPVLHLRARLEDETGHSFEGWSACGIVSMWFDKDYSKPESQRESDLLESVRQAIAGYRDAGTGSAWELHQRAEPGVRRRLEEAGLNGLTAGYGIALVDAAVIDGVCRRAGLPFHEGLRRGLLGFDPRLAAALPPAPVSAIALRHTIGLGDPLTAADVTEPIGDGLPETLEEVIARYGARYFKIKVNADRDESLGRLERIASVLQERAGDYRATLDGNEAFADMDSFLEFVELCASAERLRPLWERVLWIEQPVARQLALAPSVAAPLARVTARKPVIIDESDGDDQALDQALALGYRGISAKNCKGVFRTLKSHVALHAAGPRSGLVLSSEDLTNQPILPNHQDLCVAAALGITHSERNGHHFFRGFQFLSEKERQEALRDYPSLYDSASDGIPSLRIRDGVMSVAEINSSPGLGVRSAPDWEVMEPIVL